MIGLVVSITLAGLCCALVVRMENQRHALTEARSRLAEVHAEWAASLAREDAAEQREAAITKLFEAAQCDCREATAEWAASLQREAELRTLLARRPAPVRNVAEA